MVRDAGKEPNPFVLERWMVNYARHALTDYDQQCHRFGVRVHRPFRAVGNHAGLFWFSIYRFSVSNGAPPAVPA